MWYEPNEYRGPYSDDELMRMVNQAYQQVMGQMRAWEPISEAVQTANFDSAEAEWAVPREVSVDIWHWHDRDYVTLVAMHGGICQSGIRVPMHRMDEWR